jgi:spermidine synthase
LGAIPTYPRGTWSWTMASNRPFDPKAFDKARFAAVEKGLKYLTADILPAAFNLPPFFRAKLSKND